MSKCFIAFVIFNFASALRIHTSIIRPETIETNKEFVDEAKPEYVTIEDASLSFGQGCPDPKKPKLAICVAGSSRAFPEEPITSSFLTKLLTPATQLGAVGLTRAEPDVFVHIKQGQNSMDSLLGAVKKIHATKYTIEEGMGDVKDRSELANQECFTGFTLPTSHSGGNIVGLISYYKSIHGCYELMSEAEKKTGVKYDAVVMMRPDHQWAESHTGSRKISSGGAPVDKRIQCAKSLFATDMYSFQTRAAFEHYGKIYVDQFLNPNPTACHAEQYERIAKNVVKEINQENPGSAVYSNDHIDADKSGVWQDGKNQ